jgi:hypothetical protein
VKLSGKGLNKREEGIRSLLIRDHLRNPRLKTLRPAAFWQRSTSRDASIRFAYFLAMSVEQPAIAA